MRASDDFAVQIKYRDKKGTLTRRTVSPIKFVSQDQFSALCLCRENVRNFYFDKIEDAQLVHCSEVLMPVEIEVLEESRSSEDMKTDMVGR